MTTSTSPAGSCPPSPEARAIDFRLGLAMLWQMAAVIGLATLAWSVLPLFFRDQPIDSCVLAAGAISLATGILAIVPVAILAKRGLMPMVYGYFIGASLRMLLALAMVVWLVAGKHYPAMVLVAAMMMIYPLSLLLEASLVGRSLWSASSR